ncbi:hypothetical protein R75483_06309 [Paraburkholderia domus]|nr:hypothetical protein R75483_06309 [Paraburkholderia domus]
MSLPQAKRTDDCPDPLTVTPLASSLMYDVLPEEEIRRVQQWTGDWFLAALEQGLIGCPYVTNEATIRDIQFCYQSGLTPEEGVQYIYGPRS